MGMGSNGFNSARYFPIISKSDIKFFYFIDLFNGAVLLPNR